MPINHQILGLPRYGGLSTATYRIVFKDTIHYLPATLQQIDGATSRDAGNTDTISILRPGLLMGKITSGGQFAPSIIGVTTAAYVDGDLTVTAAAVTVTELVRRIGASGTFKLIGPPTAGGAVAETTVTYSAASGTTITVSDANVNAVSGSFICPTDGAEWPMTLIPDGYGVRVTDADAASQDQMFTRLPIGGTIQSSQIINWPSDTALRRWIVSYLNAAEGGQFVFDHNY